MHIKVNINQIFTEEKRLKAFATIFLDSKFVVTGIRIVDCKNGLTVMMPSRKDATGEYHDVCFPITPKLTNEIKNSVLNEYNEYISKFKI